MSLIVTYLCISRSGHNVWRLPLRDNRYIERNGWKTSKLLNKECIKFHAQLGKLIKMSVLTFNSLILYCFEFVFMVLLNWQGRSICKLLHPFMSQHVSHHSSYPVIALHQVFSVFYFCFISSLTSIHPYYLFRAVGITHPESPLWFMCKIPKCHGSSRV